MSIRKERFCDLTTLTSEEERKEHGRLDYEPHVERPKGLKCNERAIDKCFFCKRDYCQGHESSSFSRGVKLELLGFKENLKKVLPCCKDCETDHLPYNPEQSVSTRFDRLWRAVKRNIRAEMKEARIKVEKRKTRKKEEQI